MKKFKLLLITALYVAIGGTALTALYHRMRKANRRG
jgi:hypothetical protein